MPQENHYRSDVAVFIDFENIYVSVRDKLDANPNFEVIMDRCADLGRVVIARAYADWYRYPRVTSALYANAIEPMYVPTYYYDRDMGRTGRAIKNSVDMNLCIDAMKTLFTNPNIGKFVLTTGDRDFIPLVNSIRQQGKEVIIIGIGGAASSHLAQSADEFIFYEQLIGKKPVDLQRDQPRAKMPEKGREQYDSYEEPATQAPTPAPSAASTPSQPASREPQPSPATPDIFDVLVRAVHIARERDFVCSFGSLKLLMKELMGGEFKEEKYRDAAGRPFAKFKDFVMEAERRGKVQVFTSGAMNEVFLPGEDPYKLSRFAMDLKEEPAALPRPTPPVEERSETRAAPVGGRRRRRRSRGGQRHSPANAAEVSQNGELSEEFEEFEEPELEPIEALPGADEPDTSDAVFEELLGRVEAEASRTEELDQFDPLEILDPPLIADVPITAIDTSEDVLVSGDDLEVSLPDLPSDDEQVSPSEPEPEVEVQAAEPVLESESESTEPVAPVEQPEELAPVAQVEPFSDEEWRVFSEVMGRQERALSFVQIHDLMRDARNQAGFNRTNEELRTLIKQAINTGMLSRSGKGSRVSYRLAVPEEQVFEGPLPGTDEAQQLAEIAELIQPDSLSVGPGAAELEPVVPAAEAPEARTAEEAQSEFPEPPVEVAQPEPAPAEVAPEQPEPVAEAQPEPVAVEAVPVEAPAAPAKRPRSRRKAAATETPAAAETPVAETPVADAPASEPPAEAAPAKKTRRRKPAAEKE